MRRIIRPCAFVVAMIALALVAPNQGAAFVVSGCLDPSPHWAFLTLHRHDPTSGDWVPVATCIQPATSSLFSFDSIPEGRYRLFIDPQPYPYGMGPAYLDSWWPSAPYAFAADDIVVSGDCYLEVPAARFGYLAGRALDASGAVLSGVQVDAYRWDPNGEQWYHSGRGADSDLNGDYYDNGVMPGEYRLRFSKGGYKVAWFGGSSIDSASPVSLDNGGAISGLDATMSPGMDKPVVTISSPRTVAYGGKARLSGQATLGGAPEWPGRMKLEVSTDGRTFKTTTTSVGTNPMGSWSLSVTPTRRTWYRLAYRLWSFPTVYSPTRSVLPAAYVSTPTAPSVAYRSRSFTCAGYVKPRHAAGSAAVKLRFYRYQSGAWVLRKTVSGIASDYSSYSKYRASVALPYAGKWRVRAQHVSDTQNAGSYSGWNYFLVK